MAVEKLAARKKIELWNEEIETVKELRRHIARLRKEVFDEIASDLVDDSMVESKQNKIRTLEEEENRLRQRYLDSGRALNSGPGEE